MAGRLYIVGIGPGSPQLRTYAAVDAIRKSDVVVGYETYIGLIEDLARDKEVVSAKMREEIYRASIAISKALEGKRVALVSGGDPQVFGMAPLALEIAARRGVELEIEVIPGVTAALAAGALLGAPLGSDFAVLNLSPLLTPRRTIVERATRAVEADYVLALYNPIDRELVEEVLNVVRRVRGSVPVGVVKNAYRNGEVVYITTLDRLDSKTIDMRTVVIVGNSQTFVYRDKMVTPRGYTNKYLL